MAQNIGGSRYRQLAIYRNLFGLILPHLLDAVSGPKDGVTGRIGLRYRKHIASYRKRCFIIYPIGASLGERGVESYRAF